MSHLSGFLIVLGVMLALIEAWPWSLIPLAAAVWCWCRRRPQEEARDSGMIRGVERDSEQEGDAR